MAELTDGTYKITRSGYPMTLDPSDRVGVRLQPPEESIDYGPLQEWGVQTVGDGEFVLSNKLTGVEVAPENWESPIECQGRPGWKWVLYGLGGSPADLDQGVYIGVRVDDPGAGPFTLLAMSEGQDAWHMKLIDDPDFMNGSMWHFQAA